MIDESLRELYQDMIMDHSKHPRNCYHPDHVEASASGHNPLCGDNLTLYMNFDQNNAISEVAFEGSGCAISTASASMMTEILKGKTKAEAERFFETFHSLCTLDHYKPAIDDQDVLDKMAILSGVKQFPMRVKCATLPWHTLHAALLGQAEISTEDER